METRAAMNAATAKKIVRKISTLPFSTSEA